MSVHVAILRRPYDRLILDGRKRIECRLTKTALPPFGCITPGERIYFKISSGPFVATAVASRVLMADALAPEDIHALRKRYDKWVRGDPAYWKIKRDCRFATLIWLRDVEPSTQRPCYKPQNMRAWYTLDDGADPSLCGGEADRSAFEIELTRGAFTQRYVRLGGQAERFAAECFGGTTRADAAEPITLNLAAGPAIETDIVTKQNIFRWRGWGPWLKQHKLKPGDRLRLIPDGPRRFLVQPVKLR